MVEAGVKLRGWLGAKIVLVVAAFAAVVFVHPSGSAAHGATSNPPSRVYTCRFEQPKNSMCASAWSQNSQSLYDWMEVNIGDVGGQHQARIPDGQLCSAGRAKYAALDTPSAGWPIKDLTADAAGNYRLEYTATAPHATEYFRFYLTRQGFDAANSRLGWSDLELVFDSGPAAAQASYAWDVDLPARTGHHILYTIWQRSDSPEAFYSCSDVRLSAGGGGGTDNDSDGTGGGTVTTNGGGNGGNGGGGNDGGGNGGNGGGSGQTTSSQPTTASTARPTTASTARPTTASTAPSTTVASSSTSTSLESTSTTAASTTASSTPSSNEPPDGEEQAGVTLLPGSTTRTRLRPAPPMA